ncbi:uncharacterized protein N7518_003146 [Penicillium psychrosexuale]|uniref:uncharacterized protein n=1 Tax=Penicillium psychrosexuale TaxID=1002107 RepID=UPI002544EA36|nr:uncharacterized protein N7518_003146 [Penicillium psychrosexuale]KAJ5801078.1 hypothetical protein N7518_003146 [Penicillium psychrosexuale]
MTDAEDHPKREDQPEPENQPELENQPEPKNQPELGDQTEHDTEIKPINFEWTPELVKLATAQGLIHPSLGLVEFDRGLADCKYRPGMTIPDPADTRECLRWVGLSDKKIIEMEQKFDDLYQGPSRGYDEKFQQHARAYNDITFPQIERILNMFIQDMQDNHDEFEHTHKAYIEHGIKLGLRPEFAVFCGLHETDSRAIDWPCLFNKDWFYRSPATIMSENLLSFWLPLKEFMRSRLLYEGKAWTDRDGMWLVHEGESMDKAKARVDDRERQRLKEQAIKEKEEKLRLFYEDQAREHAEDLARWAEEDRQEAEMLKQQSIDKAALQKDEEGKE